MSAHPRAAVTYPPEFRAEVVAYANAISTAAAAAWYGLPWKRVSAWKLDADPAGDRAQATPHGTLAGYNRGCRCQPCLDARACYQQEYRRRQATGGQPHNLPEPPDMDWAAGAACAGKNTDLFFPEGSSVGAARAICNGCEVRAECLAHAIRFDERGVWGGTSERQRERIRREQARSVA